MTTTQSDDRFDLHLGDDEFAFLRDLIRERVGIVLNDSKRHMVSGRLFRRLRRRGMNSFGEYLDLLRDSPDEAELTELVNALTTNLTSFFRESHHFDVIRERVIPELVATGSRKLRIWSSACSTGQEPYSIAMTVLENLPRGPSWDVKILATDVDSDVLATAQKAVYSDHELNGVPAAKRAAWFSSESGGNYVATSALRAPIRFRQLNLLGAWPMKGLFDVIFCRNVLIYFDAPTRRKVVERMRNLVRPGGFLLLGHSESICGNDAGLESLGRTTFRVGTVTRS